MKGDPLLIDQTKINMIPHKPTFNHIIPHNSTFNHRIPHKSTFYPVIPHPSKVGVLTDRPPGTPSNTAQNQGGVNTVGSVPMTSGYGPNTFPHSAAHVLITNNSPSRSEGEPINKIHTSAANINPSPSEGVTKYTYTINSSGLNWPCFTGSDLRELSNQNNSMVKTTSFTGSTLSESQLPNSNGIKNTHFSFAWRS